MKHLFIINPEAGKTSPGEKRIKIEEAVARLPDELRRNCNFEVYITKAPMDAARKIKQEGALGDALRVYACGGDGTLNECVNGAVGLPNVAVTHYPCGTGNDFVKMFGAEAARFFDLAELVDGETRPLDVIECNGRYAMNICSVGVDARIGIDVHKYSSLPIIGGATGYAVSTVVNYVKGITSEMTVTAEGLSCGPRLNLVCVCNGQYYGGGFNPVPEARPDDGYLDVLIVSGASRATVIKAILGYAKGKYKKFPKYITPLRTRRVVVESPEEQVVNVDGEKLVGKRIEFNLVPGGVNFVVPKNMAFFKSRELAMN